MLILKSPAKGGSDAATAGKMARRQRQQMQQARLLIKRRPARELQLGSEIGSTPKSATMRYCRNS